MSPRQLTTLTFPAQDAFFPILSTAGWSVFYPLLIWHFTKQHAFHSVPCPPLRPHPLIHLSEPRASSLRAAVFTPVHPHLDLPYVWACLHYILCHPGLSNFAHFHWDEIIPVQGWECRVSPLFLWVSHQWFNQIWAKIIFKNFSSVLNTYNIFLSLFPTQYTIIDTALGTPGKLDTIKIYRRICISYLQILHHKRLECSWISVPLGLGVSWNQSPVDTKEWLSAKFTIMKWLV